MENNQKPKKRNRLTPLRVICFFLLILHSMFIATVLKMDGVIRIVCICFEGCLIAANMGLFFYFAWKKPENLEIMIGGEGNSFVEEFKEKEERAVLSKEGDISNNITVGQCLDGGIDNDQNTLFAESNANNNGLKGDNEITLELFTFGLFEDQSINYTSLKDVNDLLNWIYFHIRDYVSRYSYGHEWIAIDKETNVPIINLRMINGEEPGQRDHDNRKLRDAGINPGTTLIVFRLRGTKHGNK